MDKTSWNLAELDRFCMANYTSIMHNGGEGVPLLILSLQPQRNSKFLVR